MEKEKKGIGSEGGGREGKGRKMVGSPFNSLLGSFRQHSHDFSLQGVQHKNFLKMDGVFQKVFFSFRLKYLPAVIGLQRHISKFDQEIFFSSSSIIYVLGITY